MIKETLDMAFAIYLLATIVMLVTVTCGLQMTGSFASLMKVSSFVSITLWALTTSWYFKTLRLFRL